MCQSTDLPYQKVISRIIYLVNNRIYDHLTTSFTTGTITLLPTEVVHRHPPYWVHPNTFHPARFLERIPPFSFIPFTAGPRVCLGRHFAIMELKIVLANFYHKFEFTDPRPDGGLEKIVCLTSKPKQGIFLQVR